MKTVRLSRPSPPLQVHYGLLCHPINTFCPTLHYQSGPSRPPIRSDKVLIVQMCRHESTLRQGNDGLPLCEITEVVLCTRYMSTPPKEIRFKASDRGPRYKTATFSSWQREKRHAGDSLTVCGCIAPCLLKKVMLRRCRLEPMHSLLESYCSARLH
jgi:hypothetical protein